jgi:hypothetical protein
MQIIKKEDLLNIIGRNKELLGKVKEIVFLYLNQSQPFKQVTEITELERIVHRPPRVNPNIVTPNFQPSMHDKYRQFTR